MTRVSLVAALASLALAACGARDGASPSSPRAADRRAFIASIELCRTTEADLRAALGSPTRDGRLRSARIMSWIVGDGDVTAYVAVLLDAAGTVVDLYWDIPTEIPWTPTNQCAVLVSMARSASPIVRMQPSGKNNTSISSESTR